MRPFVLGAALLAVAVACGDGQQTDAEGADAAGKEGAEDAVPADLRPRFTPEGDLVRPEGWEAWVLAGTSMGLTYNEPADASAPGEPPGRFLNVYIQPWAYERFMASGAFPEGTMFILAGADPVDKADPARGGFYQGEVSLLEVHLKQDGLDPTGWGFYGFTAEAETARRIPSDANCYSCHRDEAAFDHAFVQFYPAMRQRLGLATAEADSTAGDS